MVLKKGGMVTREFIAKTYFDGHTSLVQAHATALCGNLVAAGHDRMVVVIRLSQNKDPKRSNFYSYNRNARFSLTALALSDDGDWLAVGSNIGKVMLIDLKVGVIKVDQGVWDEHTEVRAVRFVTGGLEVTSVHDFVEVIPLPFQIAFVQSSAVA